jgi:hypothetical protein
MNFIPNYYQSTYPNYFQSQQQPQTSSNIIWIQGENAAKSYPVVPGNSVLLMDSEQQVFYIKTVDASGLPQPLRVFPYSEKVDVAKNATTAPIERQQDYVTRDEFEKRLAEVMNAKSTIPTA